MKFFVIFSKDDQKALDIFSENNAHLTAEITAIGLPSTMPTLRNTLIADKIITSDNIYDSSQLILTKAHIDLWQEAIDDKTDITILNAQTITHPDFIKHQQKALESLNQYDLIIWGYDLNWDICVQSTAGLPKLMVTSPGNSIEDLTKPKNDLIDIKTYQANSINPQLFHSFSFAGLGCYTLSYKGAKQLLNQILPITNQTVAAPQSKLYGSNLYAIRQVTDRENISLDIEINRHLNQIDSYIAIPMIAVLPSTTKPFIGTV